MKTRTETIAYQYFVVALLLFVLQVLMGMWLAIQYFYTVPQSVVDLFPFSTARAMHTNLLVLWILLGFMGATYYVTSVETNGEVVWPRLAQFQLVLLSLTGVAALVGFFFGWTQGKPLLEIPTTLDFLVVAGALIFLANVGMTMIRANRWTAIQGSLLGGLVFLAVMYLFGMPFYKNLARDWYYWWWVIHLWVEGAWELIAAALTAFILMQLTGVDRKIVEKWLYVELGLFLFTGIVGTGHHYYWLGAPKFWAWFGGIFSALEPLPILLMVVNAMRDVRNRTQPLRPVLTWTYLIGMVVLHFVGAGLFGFAHTLPQINYYTHGSQVTVAHGHLAFFGAYALLNLTFFYLAIPRIKGFLNAEYNPKTGQFGFWAATLGLLGMSLAFSVAGVLQTYLERVQGQPYMIAQEPIRLWMGIAAIHGAIVLIGVLFIVRHLLTLKPGRPAKFVPA
jgi:nitric oxide reductase subunit B